MKVDGVEVAPVRVASANLPKPAQVAATSLSAAIAVFAHIPFWTIPSGMGHRNVQRREKETWPDREDTWASTTVTLSVKPELDLAKGDPSQHSPKSWESLGWLNWISLHYPLFAKSLWMIRSRPLYPPQRLDRC